MLLTLTDVKWTLSGVLVHLSARTAAGQLAGSLP